MNTHAEYCGNYETQTYRKMFPYIGVDQLMLKKHRLPGKRKKLGG